MEDGNGVGDERLHALNIPATFLSKSGVQIISSRHNQNFKSAVNRKSSISRWIPAALLTLGLIAVVSSAAQEKLQAIAHSALPATNAPKSLWHRVVLVGASVSAGFTESEPFGGPKTSQYRLSRYLDAAVSTRHEPPRNLGSSLIFLQPEALGRQQIEQAIEAEPTLVVGLDFLFWFCYGEGRSDEERRQRFETGLKLVEAIKCPLILGDIPDASAAVNGMLRPDQIPSTQAMASANRRLNEWAAGRKHVAIVRLSDFMRAATANQSVTIHGHTWREGTTRAFLQDDKIHPTARGCVVIALAALDVLCSKQPGTLATEVCWDPEQVLRRGSTMRQGPPSRSQESGTPPVPNGK
jgi:hypothetical protein